MHEMTQTIHTVCARDCYDVCSLIVSLDQEQAIQSIQGDPDHPLTRGRLCPRSAADREHLSRNRIDAPCIKEKGRFKETDWHTALDVIAHRLAETVKQPGPESILFLNYAGNTGLLANAYPHRLWYALGATQTDYALCSRSGHVGLALHHGSSYGADPVEMQHAGLIVFWGVNPALSAPHLWHLAQSARKKGAAKIIVVDPIRTRSARKADLWVRPKPATDVALAYGLMHQLIENQKIDAAFIRQWTTGFEHLKQAAAAWTPQKTQGATGVPQGALKELAACYGDLRPSLTLIGYGLQHCTHGSDQVRAVSLIPALLGLHRGFFYGNGGAYAVDTAYLKGKSLSQKEGRIVSQVAVADPLAKGEFRCVFVSCMNPALTLPNQRVFRSGIQREDVFMAVHDTHWTRTAAFADVVLPAPVFLEKEDVVIPDSHPFVRWSERALPPLNDSRHEIWVMRQLAERLKLKDAWLYEEPHQALRRALSDAFEAGGFDDLLAGRRLTLKRRPKDEYQTGSAKIELYSHAAAAKGWPPLPRFEPPPASLPFTYIASSVAEYTHTQFQEIYGPIPALAFLHPADAAAGDIAAGDLIWVFNDSGRIRLEARISDGIPQGVVWSPKELEDPEGSAQNCLTSSLPQQIGGGPRFNSTRVAISKCA